MGKLLKIMKIFIYVIGGIFILTAVDAFEETNTFFQNIFAFLIHSIFGIVILLFTFIFRKKNFILGIFFSTLAIFFMFFFRIYQDLDDKWFVTLVIIIPLLTIGICHIIDGIKKGVS
jgi:hypothetical protein